LEGDFLKESSGNGTSFSLGREGFGRGASLSLQRLREGNLKGRLPYLGLQETCNRRLWKRNISFYRGSIRRARPICLLGRNLYLICFSATYNLEGSWPYAGPQHFKNASAFWGAKRAC
jgi:hypothetical protein